MRRPRRSHSPERAAIVHYAARIGAITADSLAENQGSTLASARGRLAAAERDGQLMSTRPLAQWPALFTATRAGLTACGLQELEPARITAANALHAIACARVASVLERRFPGHRVAGERELRRDERLAGKALSSATLGSGPDGSPMLHRPDLVLWPQQHREELPVAVEVELTVKSPRRLVGICRAWARCRCVAGVIYLTGPVVERALARAIESVDAREAIAVVPLNSLLCEEAAIRPA